MPAPLAPPDLVTSSWVLHYVYAKDGLYPLFGRNETESESFDAMMSGTDASLRQGGG